VLGVKKSPKKEEKPKATGNKKKKVDSSENTSQAPPNALSKAPSKALSKPPQNELSQKPSLLDAGLRAEIERLSSDSSDSDSDMEHMWTVNKNLLNLKDQNWPHVTESRLGGVADTVREAIWTYIRDNTSIPAPFKKSADATQKFAKVILAVGTRNVHLTYSFWAEIFRLLFWICYYLCFSWRLAIVNTHRYLLKSDEFLTRVYNDRQQTDIEQTNK